MTSPVSFGLPVSLLREDGQARVTILLRHILT